MFTNYNTTTQQNKTKQLLTSNTINHSITNIDFSTLTNQHIFLNNNFIQKIKKINFINTNYIINALQQQISTSNYLIKNSINNTNYIIKTHINSLKTNQHNITYNLPTNNKISTTISTLTNIPLIPIIPKLSITKHQNQTTITKINIFIYHHKSQAPILQSKLSITHNNTHNT